MDLLAGQQLMKKDGAVVGADEALQDKKIIAYYFSAHWCPPCKMFTPILAEFYQDLTSNGEPIEVVFVSSDRSAEEMLNYMKESHGDWLATQHGTVLSQDLKKKYNITGIPTLVVVSKDGAVITMDGRSQVMEKGPQAFQKWLASAK